MQVSYEWNYCWFNEVDERAANMNCGMHPIIYERMGMKRQSQPYDMKKF